MSETPTPTPREDSPVSMNPGERGNANLIYILYLAGIVTGVTAIIGVVMAYMAKSETTEQLRTHYNNQINIFWKGLLYSLVGSLLTIVVIGFLVLLFALVWYIVRTVKGMQALSRGEPIVNPGSWGF